MQMMIRSTVGRVALFVVVTFAAACGARMTGTSDSPTAPSSNSPGQPTGTGSATITGTLAGVTSSSTGSQLSPLALTITISITGTGISTSVSPGGTFVLSGVPAGDVELHFSGPGIDARSTVAQVTEGEQIRIIVTVHGSEAAVNVTDRKKPENAREIEGLISAINLGARTIVVNGTTVNVPTNAIIRHGDRMLSLGDLKTGERVHVRGTLSGSIIVASEVKLQDENQPGQGEAEVEGTVSARSGSCPTVTFNVGTTKVVTDATTQFKDGTCATIANGMKVEVEGTRQADGSIKAARVEFDADKG